jgi:hypothetical protein
MWKRDSPVSYVLLQASIKRWGEGEMAKFKGTVLRDFFPLETTSCPIRHKDFKFLQFFCQGVIRIRNRLPGVFTTGEL